MIGLIIAAVAALPILFSEKTTHDVERYRLPCYPDTTEVIEQQICCPDTTWDYPSMVPRVTYKVILCK